MTSSTSTTAIARAYRLAHAHAHGWAVARPQWAWKLVVAGMPAELVSEWTHAAVLAEDAAARVAAESSATAAYAAYAAYEAAQAAQAERAWTAVQTWASNAGLDSVLTTPGASIERGPTTPAECEAANALADAEAERTGWYSGLSWSPDEHGTVRHLTCTGATEWVVTADGTTTIRRMAEGDHEDVGDNVWRYRPGPCVASATIRADGRWRAEVSAEASERDVSRLCECIEAALALPQGAATRGVLLGCDPYDLRLRAERGDARAASALLPLPVAMQLAEVVS
jgi:hypothetical protein